MARAEIHQHILKQLLGRPEAEVWPAFAELVQREVRPNSTPCWEYPLLAARAVGADEDVVLPATVAIFCQYYAIHLIDDLLDEDPKGVYHRHGIGPTANVAALFQAVGALALAESSAGAERVALGQEWMAQMVADTAVGQHLDVLDADDEEGYWRIAESKTPPLFRFGLAIGALLGGAEIEVAEEIGRLGQDLGLMVQASDDLNDALATPAQGDWHRDGTNLAILYARTVGHDERDRFEELRHRADEPDVLEELRQILVRSGAFSFCAYKMLELGKSARRRVDGLDLADPEPLNGLITGLLRPLHKLLERAGVEEPERLIEDV